MPWRSVVAGVEDVKTVSGRTEMIQIPEVVNELQNEINELRDYQHRIEKTLARTEHWHTRKASNPNTQARITERETLEEVLRVFDEEVSKTQDRTADSFGRKTITAKEGTAIVTGERVIAIAGTWDLVELQHLFDEMDKLRHGEG